jgi:hypothetical protein
MKITELINDHERLDEAGATTIASKALSKVFGGAAHGLANLFGNGSNTRIIASLVKDIENGATLTTKSVMRTHGLTPEKAKALLHAARQEAGTAARVANWNANIAGIGQTASAVKSWTGTLINLGLTGAYYWMLYEPLRDYMNNIEEAEKMLQAGGGKDPTPEDFEAYRRKEMSVLIGRWATLWATGKLVKLPFSIVSRMFGKFSPGLATAVSTLGRGGQVYFMNQINDPDNAKTIATWMSGPIASTFIGGAGVAAENKIRSWIPGAKEYDQAQATKPSKPETGDEKEVDGTDKTDLDNPADNTDTPKTTKPDPTNKAKVKLPFKPDEWEFYSTGIYRNKKTGELDYRDNYL